MHGIGGIALYGNVRCPGRGHEIAESHDIRDPPVINSAQTDEWYDDTSCFEKTGRRIGGSRAERAPGHTRGSR